MAPSRSRGRLSHICGALGPPARDQSFRRRQQQQHVIGANCSAAAAAVPSRKGAKISDIKCYLQPYFMVKVETDQGVYGWGESGIGKQRGLAVQGAVQHYREFLLGRDCMEVGALWQEMYRSQYFEGGRVLTGAQSAIDLALHDIIGKVLGVPVFQLLGGKHRDFVPCFPTCFLEMGPDAVRDAVKLRKEGWDVIRFVGAGHSNATEMSGQPKAYEPRESIAKTVKWLPKIRQAVDEIGHTTLILEYHHRLSVTEAASLCHKLPPGTIDGLEEPIRDESVQAYESLRTMTPVPFALGEEFASKWQFLPFLEKGLTNFCRVDIINVGGFTETMKVAGWAEAHYIDLMPHNPFGPICTAACIHVGVAAPNFAAMEVFQDRTIDAVLFPQHHKREGGSSTDGDGGIYYPTPSAVGLGVDVNEAELMKLEFTLSRGDNFLRRKDGSVTNW